MDGSRLPAAKLISSAKQLVERPFSELGDAGDLQLGPHALDSANVAPRDFDGEGYSRMDSR